jgi:hypothetical protein
MMTLEQHIEELHAEPRNAPTTDEHPQIKTELDAAIGQLADEIEN